MKKLIALFAFVAVMAMATTLVVANPGQNPNRNPGSPEQNAGGVTITVTGGGNNLVIRAICNTTGDSVVVPRAGNGTFSQSFEVFGYDVSIRVQGNSLRDMSATAQYVPCDEPYVVGTREFRVFTHNEDLASVFLGTEEVSGSRELNGLNVSSTVVEVNFSHHIANATGSGVKAGFTATGTLYYDYIRNYLEQYERWYVMHVVDVYSDGTEGTPALIADSAHTYGGVQDGGYYYTTEHQGSRAIGISGGEVFLTRGEGSDDGTGTGQGFPRAGTASYGGLCVTLYLANQSPRVNVIGFEYDIEVL